MRLSVTSDLTFPMHCDTVKSVHPHPIIPSPCPVHHLLQKIDALWSRKINPPYGLMEEIKTEDIARECESPL